MQLMQNLIQWPNQNQMFKAFRNFELCLIILAMGNCSCRPLACMGMDKKGNTPETWIRLYGGALVSVCFPVRFVCPSQSHQRCSIKEIAPPHFFRNDLPLRIEMQWKVQDWNRTFFFTKNLSKRRGPDMQACGLFLWRSHRQLIRRGSCTTQTAAGKRRGYSNAPRRLGRWLVACPFFSCFFGGLLRVWTPPFFGARGLFQTPKVTGFEVKGLIKWKVKKTQECTRNWLEWIPNTSEPNLVSTMDFKVPIPSSRILSTKHCLIERWKQIYAFTTGGDKHYHNWL